MAGLRSMNGILEFVDTADFTTMNNGEHFMCTDVEWDPTGRYLMTGVSWWGHKVDNAYWMWSFQGRILKRYQVDRFCQFLWRPRPPTLLAKKQIQKIKKNLKTEYSPAFDVEDKFLTTKVSEELVQKRRDMFQKFDEWRKAKMEVYKERKEQRIELRGGVDTDPVRNILVLLPCIAL